MSVYTHVSNPVLQQFLTHYNVGELLHYQGIMGGVDNTNYFVTTSQGEYVLTLFETTPLSIVSFCLHFTQYLSSHKGAMIPAPVTTKSNKLISELHGKSSVLIHKAEGSHPSAPFNVDMMQSLGQAVGKIHCAGITYNSHDSHHVTNLGCEWRIKTANHLSALIPPDTAQWLQHEMQEQMAFDDSSLPKGFIHADIFPDNTLFLDNDISAIIDWYFTTYDLLLYDLAIIVNAWCLDEKSTLIPSLTSTFLNAYHQERPLTKQEKLAWPMMLRIAAMRFWLSRTYDQLYPRSGIMRLVKDPNEYKVIMQQHAKHTHTPWIE